MFALKHIESFLVKHRIELIKYKKGFDVIMVDSIDEINRCVESAGIISNTCGKIIFTVYDISMGNKVIRKNKEGKI